MRRRHGDLAPSPPLGGLRGEWTRAFVVGELIGFVPPAVTGATLAALDAPDPVLVAGLVLAGLLEGAVIGIAGARVLRRHAPDVSRAGWVRATMLAAGLAWLAGMGGGSLMGAEVLPPALAAAMLVPVWLGALTSMGYLQWRVLRRTVPDSARWVPVTTGAWLIGVMIPVVALSSVPDGWPAPVHVVVAVAAAVAMGLTVGALTGRTLERLLAARGRG